jgi:hypothetical protein
MRTEKGKTLIPEDVCFCPLAITKEEEIEVEPTLCSFLTVADHTEKTQYQKFETNIPRKGIAQPQSQFPHSSVCERFIYFHDRSA